MALTDKLTAIGDAIRSKTGGSDLLTLDEMPQEIQSIQTGGGTITDTELADSILDGSITSYSSSDLTSIWDYAFYGRAALIDVTLPNVTLLKSNVFNGCTSLQSISINWEQITELPNYTFKDCLSLNSPTTFPSVMEVGQSCFDTSSFTVLKFPSLMTATSYGCFTTSSISSRQFLTTLTIGAKCTFGSSCFRNQGKLVSLVLSSSELCTAQNSNLFQNTPIEDGTGYIYVPQALIEQYKVATNWATFANQFRAIEDYPEICGEVS